MKLSEAIQQLESIEGALREAYTGAFPRPMGAYGEVMMPARFAWEVRLCSGTELLAKSILKLKSTLAEAHSVDLEVGRVNR